MVPQDIAGVQRFLQHHAQLGDARSTVAAGN
jgi:hypothetical protein